MFVFCGWEKFLIVMIVFFDGVGVFCLLLGGDLKCDIIEVGDIVFLICLWCWVRSGNLCGGLLFGGWECVCDGGFDCGVGLGLGFGFGLYVLMMKGFDDRLGKVDLGGGFDVGFDLVFIWVLLFGKWEVVGVKVGLCWVFGEL